MEQSARDRLTVEKYLATARERLRALRDLLDDGASEVGVLRVAVVSALGAVDDAHSIVADPREAARVACPYCGYRIMSDATLCLSCWRKLDPKRTS
jgi:DNA-directed RNA polymerase subunit RPC12/RpoP